MARVLTPQADDFPRWYQDVLAKAELAENGPVRGTMVIRPDGYALWERMQAEVDDRIKATGARNAYFPLFIPESYLKREAEHVEGFSPELAVVTIGGGKQLEEPAIVRPTSETIVNASFAKWVQSYRDLPLLINQWANVVRWELRPRLFLRTSEFLWQEGHTAHATEAEARAYAIRILRDVYEDFMVDVLAMPVVVGRKTVRERFAGATNTMTLELMTGDGKALQMGTSHELGQNFAKAFGIEFLAPHGSREHAWQTSWGSSTRMVGGLIMAHGDDDGLRVPPRLAPTQVAVLVVKEAATPAAEALAADLRAAGVRVVVDDGHRRAVRPAGGRLGAQGRAAAGRGRAARPGRRAGHPGAPDPRRQGAGAAGRAGRRGADGAGRGPGRAVRRGRAAAGRPDRGREDGGGRGRGGRGRLGPDAVGGARPGGRGPAGRAVGERALPDPAGRVAAGQRRRAGPPRVLRPRLLAPGPGHRGVPERSRSG